MPYVAFSTIHVSQTKNKHLGFDIAIKKTSDGLSIWMSIVHISCLPRINFFPPFICLNIGITHNICLWNAIQLKMMAFDTTWIRAAPIPFVFVLFWLSKQSTFPNKFVYCCLVQSVFSLEKVWRKHLCNIIVKGQPLFL